MFIAWKASKCTCIIIMDLIRNDVKSKLVALVGDFSTKNNLNSSSLNFR